jgi:hypothetical protein
LIEEQIQELFRLFINRQDVYAAQQPDGSYLKRQRNISNEIVRRHLEGNTTVGVYSTEPATGQVKWICFDVDPGHHSEPRMVVKKILQSLNDKLVPKNSVLLEGSRYPDQSYHLWIFVNPVNARDAYVFGNLIKADINEPELEVFPKQPEISADGYGNLVKLPLGLHRKYNKKSVFLDAKNFKPIEPILEETKTCNLLAYLPEYEDYTETIELDDYSPQVINLRPCFRAMLNNSNIKALNQGELTHEARMALVNEMLANGFGSRHIAPYFKELKDYDHSKSEYYVKKLVQVAIEKGIHPWGCETLQVYGWCTVPDPSKCQSKSTAKQSRKNVATRIIHHIDRLNPPLVFFNDQYKTPYVRVPVIDGNDGIDGKYHYKIIRVESTFFKTWLAELLWNAESKIPSQTDVNSALNYLKARANRGKQIKLYNRVAGDSQTIYIDVADKHNHVIKITSEGWEVIENPPILFRRYSHQLPLVDINELLRVRETSSIPSIPSNNNVRCLLKHVNIVKNDGLLFLIDVVSKFVPGIPHAILNVYGLQGYGKSTILRLVRMLVDPSSLELLSLPRSKAELVQQLDHNWCAFYDNVSYIESWISDELCRAVTGGGFSKRKLFTDADDIIFNFKRCIGINGINNPAYRGDLLDRCLLLEVKDIHEIDRKTEEQIFQEFHKDKQMILVSIFDTLSKAISIYPSIKLDRLFRLADYMKWGYAITEALVIPGR